MNTVANAEEPDRGHDLIDAVRTMMVDLPREEQEAIELHYFAGMSQAVAASVIGIREGTMAMRLSRGRERLRQIFARRGMVVTSLTVIGALSNQPSAAAGETLLDKVRSVARSTPITPSAATAGKASVISVAGTAAAILAVTLLVLTLGQSPGRDARPGPSVSLPMRTISQPVPSVAHSAITERHTKDQDSLGATIAPVVPAAAQLGDGAGVQPEREPTITLSTKSPMRIKNIVYVVERLGDTRIELVGVDEDEEYSVEYSETPLSEVLRHLAKITHSTLQKIDDQSWQLVGTGVPQRPNGSG